MSTSTFTPDPSWPSIVELAIELWGRPNEQESKPDDIRFGRKASKKVRPSTNQWWNFEEDTRARGYVEIHKAARGPLPQREQIPKRKPGNGAVHDDVPPWENVGVQYPYTDADWKLILEVVRTKNGSPRFLQRQPIGKSATGEIKWKWSVKDLPNHDCLLYRLPELRAAPLDETALIPEGEKDVDRLRNAGLIATTNIGGAGKWRDEYAEEFRSRHCVVLADNDPQAKDDKTGKPKFHPDGRPVLPGQDHAAHVARSIAGIAASVKVLLLPGLPEKGDVSNWLDAAHTIDELQRLARETPEYRQDDADLPPDDLGKPVLRLRYGFDATLLEPMGTVVAGLLHRGSVTLVYGPPKSAKSFWLTELALAVADKEQSKWMDHEVVQHGPMLYVACEGHAGFPKRLAAASKTRGWDRATFPPGFILATGRPMLIKVEEKGLHYAPDPSSILAALEDAKRHGLDPVSIVIDTVFRSFGAGNVNASPDMNVYLAAVAMLTDQGYAVALVHHEVKLGGTPAGSVALIGGVETIIHIWRESDTSERKFWQVEMAKDDAETKPRAFTLEVIPIGLDPDGRPASSCVVRDGGAAPDATAKKKRGRPPSDNSKAAVLASLIYDELCNLLADPREGQDVPIHPEAPPIRVVSRPRLREAINRAGILPLPPDDTDQKRVTDRNNERVRDAINLLKTQRKAVANEQWIGLTKSGGA